MIMTIKLYPLSEIMIKWLPHSTLFVSCSKTNGNLTEKI